MGCGKAICQQVLQGGFQESGEFQISGHSCFCIFWLNPSGMLNIYYESSVRGLSCRVEHRTCDAPRNRTLSRSYALIKNWVDNS